jgi:hypothetical protein
VDITHKVRSNTSRSFYCCDSEDKAVKMPYVEHLLLSIFIFAAKNRDVSFCSFKIRMIDHEIVMHKKENHQRDAKEKQTDA